MTVTLIESLDYYHYNEIQRNLCLNVYIRKFYGYG